MTDPIIMNVKDNITQPATLQEAINTIKFLTTSHKQEIVKLKEKCRLQSDAIKKLETNRKKELEFLSNELYNYEKNLQQRTENINKQLAQKDDIIQKQIEEIEDLNKKLKMHEIPEINITADSNSDSGVAMDNDESIKLQAPKIETKATRKCSRRIADSISFLRARVDFSPMKYKPSFRDGNKKKEDKSHKLEVPAHRVISRQICNESVSDDERRCSVTDEPVFLDCSIEPIVLRPVKMNDSMNNHFSDDGSEDTSEEVFDRVMTRSSIRRSVKANPKYKKINRTKSKLLEQVKINIID